MITDKFNIPTEILQLISVEQAYYYNIIPLSFENEVLLIAATSNSYELKNELEIVLGYKIELHRETEESILKLLQKFYRKSSVSKTGTLHYSDDFLMYLIEEAQSIKASDIHFEAFENNGRVRYRIDGKLIEKYIIPKDEYPIVINRLKIMSGADIAEKRLPQDGRIDFKLPDENFDIRVSILPSLHGEKIVLRLLTKNNSFLDLAQLGFEKTELEDYYDGIRKENGIVLISGPTGSGKTTTLYATLKYLNKPDINILTIEDPIEYTLDGITQVQVKESIGLGFQDALRTFLRQDPNIIMVGEIRDVETANMAVRASLTGHLVLATIHTNSAWATISRLIDMGIPSFLIANTLNMSIAQRLIRKLCNHCKKESTLNSNVFPKNLIISSDFVNHYEPVGCEHCHYTGYSGRQAIYEIIPIKQDLIDKIKNRDLEISEYLKQNNILTLKENAILLAKKGTTSIEEIYGLLID